MCGIAGIYNRGSLPEDILVRMTSVIRHRGPDETGMYVDPVVALGHARLSIVDLGGGCQPIGNEDGTIWVVYNGEVFNYLELKELLLKDGHVFETECDTEVLVHLYEEYGTECLGMLNGQFAFAIWDSVRQELFLARDRVGIRPLYYTWAGKQLVFASEIKALFQCPGTARELDLEALAQVFTFWTTVGSRTPFKGVYELPPGHFMRVRKGEVIQRSYWRIPGFAAEEMWAGTFAEAEEELQVLLKDAVRLRLRADVPVGAYLSGGLDSSILTTLIAKHFNNRLRTFSLGFEESTFDESSYQRELVKSLGTEHSHILVRNEDIRDHLPQVIWHCEKPLLRTSPVPLLLLSGLARSSGFKVVLTGEGADEIFGGYNIFKEAKVRRFWGTRPESRLRPLLLERLYPYILNNPARGRVFLQKFFAVKPGQLDDPLFSHRVRWENGARNRSFFCRDVQEALEGYHPMDAVAAALPEAFHDRDPLGKAQFLEMEIFLSNYLLSSQGDRVAMANSLELRHPFLDYRLIEFAFRLPPHWKLRGLREKYILKHAFSGVVPESIRMRPKQPYRAPIGEVFLRDGGKGYVAELLSGSALKRSGYFDELKVGHLVDKYRRGESSVANEWQNMALMGILTTQLLHLQFVEQFPLSGTIAGKPDKVVRRS